MVNLIGNEPLDPLHFWKSYSAQYGGSPPVVWKPWRVNGQLLIAGDTENWADMLQPLASLQAGIPTIQNGVLFGNLSVSMWIVSVAADGFARASIYDPSSLLLQTNGFPLVTRTFTLVGGPDAENGLGQLFQFTDIGFQWINIACEGSALNEARLNVKFDGIKVTWNAG